MEPYNGWVTDGRPWRAITSWDGRRTLILECGHTVVTASRVRRTDAYPCDHCKVSQEDVTAPQQTTQPTEARRQT